MFSDTFESSCCFMAAAPLPRPHRASDRRERATHERERQPVQAHFIFVHVATIAQWTLGTVCDSS